MYDYTRIGKHIILNVVSILKDFSRSLTVMYAVIVVISRKRCKITTDHK